MILQTETRILDVPQRLATREAEGRALIRSARVLQAGWVWHPVAAEDLPPGWLPGQPLLWSDSGPLLPDAGALLVQARQEAEARARALRRAAELRVEYPAGSGRVSILGDPAVEQRWAMATRMADQAVASGQPLLIPWEHDQGGWVEMTAAAWQGFVTARATTMLEANRVMAERLAALAAAPDAAAVGALVAGWG